MNKEFNKGLLLAGFGSFWWGFLGVLYFKYITFIGHIELVVHRCLWTTFTLIITTFLFSKWHIFFDIIQNKKTEFLYNQSSEFFPGVLNPLDTINRIIYGPITK